jgi:hypothetical protein
MIKVSSRPIAEVAIRLPLVQASEAMPQAKPPSDPVPPAPLAAEEAAYIRQIARQFYGDDVVVRNYGPDPRRLELHIETAKQPGMEQHECLGFLMCEIERDAISLEVMKRGSRLHGNSKIAYRQGDIV